MNMERTAQDFLSAELSHGLTLSTFVRRSVDLSSGSFVVVDTNQIQSIMSHDLRDYSLARPLSTPAYRYQDGRQSYLIQHDDDSQKAKSALVAYLKKNQRQSELIVLENMNAQKEDVQMDQDSSHAIYHGNEVYQVVWLSEKDDQIYRTIVDAQSGWRSVGFVLSIDPSVGNRESVSSQSLKKMVSHILIIFARVFDGSAYLIWCRDS